MTARKLVAVGLSALLVAGMVVLGQGASAQEASTTTSAPATGGAYPYSFAPTTVPSPLVSVPPQLLTGPRKLSAFAGFGTWLDVYDWTARWHAKAKTRSSLGDIDRMAAAGVQTLFIQTGKWDSPTDVHEPARLLPLIARAKARGMDVVAWYLPTFQDVDKDLRRLVAAASIPGVDALGVDIESSAVKDPATRNQRLVDLSARLRQLLPGVALAAIPYPPVVFQSINLNLWPGFPWSSLASSYDVWMPMSYQSHRKVSSGWRDAYRYTADNVDRVRASLGPDVLIHAIGGIANATSVNDVNGMLRASSERGVIGGSLYDWPTTPATLLSALRSFRTPIR